MNYYMQIHEYIHQKLSADAHAAFEAALKKDPDLVAEVLLTRQIMDAMKYDDWLQKMDFVQNAIPNTPIEPDFTPIEPDSKAILPRNAAKWWHTWQFGIMGMSVVLLVVMVLRWQQREAVRARLQQIAAPHWKLENLVRVDSLSRNFFDVGIRSFEKGNYVEAVYALENHLKNAQEDVTAKLYLGAACALSNQEIKAIAYLKPIAAGQLLESNVAQWLLSLCYLRNGQAQAAEKTLQLLKSDAIYGEKAQRILAQLSLY